MLSLSPAKWTRILVPIAAALLLLAAACGDDDDGGDGNGDGNGNGGTATATAPADDIETQPDVPQEVDDAVTEAVDGVLEITATDTPTTLFTPNNLKVPLNETTMIEITNAGAVPHNFRIAGADGEWTTDDDSVSGPESVILGGEAGVVDFTPTLAGTYTFRCDIHPDVQGGVIVAG